jgi:hypothetical protein
LIPVIFFASLWPGRYIKAMIDGAFVIEMNGLLYHLHFPADIIRGGWDILGGKIEH